MSDYYSIRQEVTFAGIDRLREHVAQLLNLARTDAAPRVLIRCKPRGHDAFGPTRMPRDSLAAYCITRETGLINARIARNSPALLVVG